MKTAKIVAICFLSDQICTKVAELAKMTATPVPGSLTGEVQALKKATDLLAQAWSDMAIRNLLSDMLCIVRKLDTYNCTNACKDLIRTVQQLMEMELEAHSPTLAKYTKVVLVGYKVKCSGGSYSGNEKDPDDMLDRCRDLKEAIRNAYTLVDRMGTYNGDGTILKIFMAPEFYFRGKNGVYTHEVVHGREAQPDAKLPKVQGIMEVMSEEIDKEIYKDWLFVLGTAIAATELTETVCKVCDGEVKFVKDTVTFNTKPVCKANPKHATQEKSRGAFVENVALVKKQKETHTITKELISDNDYVNNHVTIEGSRRMKVNPDAGTNVPTKFKDERMGGCIFTIDGVTIGLEVCLDHRSRSASGSPGRLEHAGNIQIQLIPSAGVTIESLRTIAGGIVFNVDGSGPHVQVVAGSTPEAFFNMPTAEFQFSGATWGDLAPTGLDMAAIKTIKTLTVTEVTTTSHVAHAGKGAVVGYGPYDIPRV
jgi:hypothetical protein